MHYLQNGSQVSPVPATKPRTGTPGYFAESGVDNRPSYPGQDWFNAVIQEFQGALAANGVAFDAEKFDHLSKLFGLYVRSDSSATDEDIDNVSVDNKYILLPQLWRAFDVIRPLKTYTNINQLNLTDDDFAPPATLRVLSDALPPGSLINVDISDGDIYPNLRLLMPEQTIASSLQVTRGIYQSDSNRVLYEWFNYGSIKKYIATSDISSSQAVTPWQRYSFSGDVSSRDIPLIESVPGFGGGVNLDWSSTGYNTSDFDYLAVTIDIVTNDVNYPDGPITVFVDTSSALASGKASLSALVSPGSAAAATYTGAVNISESGMTTSVTSLGGWSSKIKRVHGINY